MDCVCKLILLILNSLLALFLVSCEDNLVNFVFWLSLVLTNTAAHVEIPESCVKNQTWTLMVTEYMPLFTKLDFLNKCTINNILVQRCCYRKTIFNSIYSFSLILYVYKLIFFPLFLYEFDLFSTLDCIQYTVLLSNSSVIHNKLHLNIPSPTL